MEDRGPSTVSTKPATLL